MKNIINKGLAIVLAGAFISSAFANYTTVDKPMVPQGRTHHDRLAYCKTHQKECDADRAHNETYCAHHAHTKFCKAHHHKAHHHVDAQ